MGPHELIETEVSFASANSTTVTLGGGVQDDGRQVVIVGIEARMRGGTITGVQVLGSELDGGTLPLAWESEGFSTLAAQGRHFASNVPVACTPGNRITLQAIGVGGGADGTSCTLIASYYRRRVGTP